MRTWKDCAVVHAWYAFLSTENTGRLFVWLGLGYIVRCQGCDFSPCEERWMGRNGAWLAAVLVGHRDARFGIQLRSGEVVSQDANYPDFQNTCNGPLLTFEH